MRNSGQDFKRVLVVNDNNCALLNLVIREIEAVVTNMDEVWRYSS